MFTLTSIALFVSAGLAGWVAILVQRRPSTPGARPLVGLLAAVAWWCVAGACDGFVNTAEQKIFWAKLQYLGITSAPPLWLQFAGAYAGVSWFRDRRHLIALWFIPVTTVFVAATNEWHLAMWPTVTIRADGATIYGHGWWFWTAISLAYVYVLAGALLVARTLRRSPPPFRAQHHALIAASLLPLLGNAFYISGLTAEGFDPTPYAFTLSALLFTWAVYRHNLFDLVPVARDMVVDSLSDAVIVIDPSRRVLDMNAAARALVGREGPWLGLTIESLLPFLDQTVLALTHGVESTAVVDVGGVPTHFEVRLVPVRTEMRADAAWLLLLRDVTAQRRAADERDAMAARMQEQQRRESLSVLAGGLAHDFNNLLASIIGNADLLMLRLSPSSEMGTSVGAILLGAQRAADLVDKMLAYAGERHGSTSRIDLDHLVRDLLDLLQTSAARHCTLHYEGTPAIIDADATQIRQVVMNLIINAAEAVEEPLGAVRIRLGVERLSRRKLSELSAPPAAVQGNFAYVEVHDNGHGMDGETLQRIFDPFFTTKASGHGLGLAAVQGIVRGHGGAMYASSTPGVGTTFRCWFPLADMNQAPGVAHPELEPPKAPEPAAET